MAPLYKRPVDLLIVLVFAQFLCIALIGKPFVLKTVSYLVIPPSDFTQSVYGSILATEDRYWPPAPVLDAHAWWCENVDVLLAHNPVW